MCERVAFPGMTGAQAAKPSTWLVPCRPVGIVWGRWVFTAVCRSPHLHSGAHEALTPLESGAWNLFC